MLLAALDAGVQESLEFLGAELSDRKSGVGQGSHVDMSVRHGKSPQELLEREIEVHAVDPNVLGVPPPVRGRHLEQRVALPAPLHQPVALPLSEARVVAGVCQAPPPSTQAAANP